jgi:hypothetical protein
MKQEYISLKKLACKYDLHQDTIRSKMKCLVENVHYIRVGKLYRYHIEEMHKFLTGKKTVTQNVNIDGFLIDTVE